MLVLVVHRCTHPPTPLIKCAPFHYLARPSRRRVSATSDVDDPCGGRGLEGAAERVHALAAHNMRGTGGGGSRRIHTRAKPEPAGPRLESGGEHVHALAAASMRGTGGGGSRRTRAQPEPSDADAGER